MKILILNTYDNKGGAARASFRLAKALFDYGVDVKFVVRKKNLTDTFVDSARESFPSLKPYLDYIPTLIFTRKRFPFFSAIVKDKLLQHVEEFRPDVIHLNWMSEGFMRIETLSKLGIPIVWTLHDSWAFTGGCHVPGGCEKYKSKCEYCHYLSPRFKSDLSNYNFKRKSTTYNQINKLHVVTPSDWLAHEVRSSTLLRKFPVEVIPNSLDTKTFYASDKKDAKHKLGLDTGKKTIIFGGINPVKDPNKGYDLLLKTLKYFKRVDYELVIFGNNKAETSYINSIKTLFLGKVNGDSKLRDIYSAGDVTVVPSRSESFGQVLTESMACGTPVVAFNATGPAEIIDHKMNGYLAKSFDPENMADGITWVLGDKKRWNQLSENARSQVKLNYASDIIAKKYIDLYKNILSL